MSIVDTGSGHDPGVGHKSIEPLSVSILTAREVSGLGNTKLYELIKTGRLESTRVGSKRLVNYASLKKLVGAE
jgi:excisionase family DNA binding protein